MSSEKDKSDKIKVNTQIKHVPKDAQVVMSILRELGVHDYEPTVINQLLEFTYRYVTCILDDAKVYANHAKKKIIDLDDVKLASEMVLDKSFTTPPPRHVLAKLSEVRNAMPLQPIKPHCGLRLPPDRYCLSACNYKLRATAQHKKLIKSAIESRSLIKTQIKPQLPNPTLKRQQPTQPKTQTVTIPKPVFKFASQNKQPSGPTAGPSHKPSFASSSSSLAKATTSSIDVVKMETEEEGGALTGGGTFKRAREEDDFEMVG